MKKEFFFLLIFSFSILKGYCQLERTTTQAGVSILPIYDVLNFFPDNKISGFAISGNIGYLTLKNMSIGIKPFMQQERIPIPLHLMGIRKLKT